MSEPLGQDERDSFRAYAEANMTEPDGTQSQWADYTVRLLDSHDRLAVLYREEKAKRETAEVSASANHRRMVEQGLRADRVEALYREAVEALEECATWSQELQDRLELHGNAIAYWRGVVAVAKAALAKARTAGIGPEGGK